MRTKYLPLAGNEKLHARSPPTLPRDAHQGLERAYLRAQSQGRLVNPRCLQHSCNVSGGLQGLAYSNGHEIYHHGGEDETANQWIDTSQFGHVDDDAYARQKREA